MIPGLNVHHGLFRLKEFMSSASSVKVTVPATTANVGPGFDCLGAALSLYNHFQFQPLAQATAPPLAIYINGLEAEKLPDDDSNLVYQSFRQVYRHLNQDAPPIQIDIELDIPLTRGLGSSATAIVGGLVGANALSGFPLSQEELVQLAITMEGHPDNVVPAMLGGCQLSIPSEDRWIFCDVPWHETIVPVVAIPDFELSTEAARQVMPKSYSQADAVFNVSHLGLLLRGLETGQVDWLSTALRDKIHQPYRQPLIPGYEDVATAAINSGAYGVVISGAGPSLLALCSYDTQETVMTTMKTAWQSSHIHAEVKHLSLDKTGATYQVNTE